jgi:hypothetical protein
MPCLIATMQSGKQARYQYWNPLCVESGPSKRRVGAGAVATPEFAIVSRLPCNRNGVRGPYRFFYYVSNPTKAESPKNS